jgi:hypothetical protein
MKTTETRTTNDRLDWVLDEITRREIEIFVQESIERHKEEIPKTETASISTERTQI